MFKVGDRVKITSANGVLTNGEYTLSVFKSMYDFCVEGHGSSYGSPLADYKFELIEPSLTNNQMDIKEKFVLALTPEPKKSFRKAGITNGDDLLTDEGQRIFLTWLLHSKYADEFKKDVVDGLLADQEKNN